MKELKVVVSIAVDEKVLEEKKTTIEKVVEDIYVLEDDVVDGVVILRRGKQGDITTDFFLHAPTIESIKVIGGEEDE